MNNNTQLNEKDVLNDLLTMEKQITSAYNVGITEASCKNLRQTLTTSLNDTQTIQYNVFDAMRKHGWYQTKDAADADVNNAKNKFTQMKNEL